MRLTTITTTLLVILALVACDSKERVKADADHPAAPMDQSGASQGTKFIAKEVIHGSTYTYILADENGQEYWMASSKTPVEAGMTLYYDGAVEMFDFPVKELDKTFERILFVNQIKGTSSANARQTKQPGKAMELEVEKAVNGVSIAEIYTDPAKYNGQTVTVRGQVTKFNGGIMGRNWVHIQDGTSANGSFDLTLTTTATVEKGSVHVFTGKVALNKDFGAGYVYDVIIEETEIAKES